MCDFFFQRVIKLCEISVHSINISTLNYHVSKIIFGEIHTPQNIKFSWLMLFGTFAYETPVCYSDMPFFREQVGDSVFFMDLRDPSSLVKNILTIQNDKQIVEEKKEKGLQVLKNWNEEDFYKKLLNIFNEYKYIRELWK